ncbi:MAG: DUF3159 domain-containing protein [Microbacteriaceae bacterium]|nr:DUF3159 domain-containing protein [Microbacteriaceae bacterium]
MTRPARDDAVPAPAEPAPSEQAPTGPAPADAEQVQARLAAAARASTVGRVAEEGVSWPAFLAAMGGWLGIAEALLPGLLFLGLHLATGELLLSVAAPAVLAVVLLVVRLVRRQPISGALAGLFGLVISGFIALRSGEGVDYFVLGLWTNAVYGTGVLLTMLAGWPLIGVIAGLISGRPTAWRRDLRFFWWMQGLTAVWVGLFAARLAVQLPLYLAGAVEPLGVARLVMGVPLFAAVAIATALLVRRQLQRTGAGGSAAAVPPAAGPVTDPASEPAAPPASPSSHGEFR